MNCTDFQRALDDYLDEELSPLEARVLEAHAATCTACNGALLRARQLQQRAFALAGEREPAHDLWPGIAAGLAPHEHAARERRWPRALAAGLAVIAVFAGGMLADRVMRDEDAATRPKFAERLPSAAEARRILPASYVELIEGSGTAGEQALLRNLLVVNLAIREIEAAIADDPSNADLRELLSGLYAEEHRILGQAERLQTARQAPTRTTI